MPSTLQSLVKIPRFFDSSHPPGEAEFQSLAAKIQIFLANNSLSYLPPSIWSLENLTVLSLRNNQLTSIPSGIGKLTNLVELNLANNKLRWLPWEILKLLGPGKSLTKLHIRPNPFFVGVKADVPFLTGKFTLPSESSAYEEKIKSLKDDMDVYNSNKSHPARWLCKLMEGIHQTIQQVDRDVLSTHGPKCLWEEPDRFASSCVYIASTSCWYLESDGMPTRTMKTFAPSRAPLTESYLLADPYQSQPKAAAQSRVPSLLELCMTQCAASPILRQLESLLPPDAPTPVLRALEETCVAVNDGGRICSVCSRSYQIPRVEWIEYWHCIPRNASTLSPEDIFLPFLRRGCSFACVP